MVEPGAAIGSAVARGVGAAASEALGEEQSIKVSVAEKAKDSPGLEKAAALRGQRAAVRQAVILQLWKPLARIVGVSREYFEDGGQFAVDMSTKLDDVPDEKLITPKANVAVPAMQGLGFSLDEPSLKEMYLQLLAQASNSDTSDLAHPSFAQIIRELQPEEATLLHQIFSVGPRHPIVRLDRRTDGEDGIVPLQAHLLPISDETGSPVENTNTPVWIDNWVRLGLATVDYQGHLTSPTAYDWADNRPELLSARSTCPEGQTVEIRRGYLDVTDFGKRFVNIVFEKQTNS